MDLSKRYQTHKMFLDWVKSVNWMWVSTNDNAHSEIWVSPSGMEVMIVKDNKDLNIIEISTKIMNFSN
jgi:hypothetical protein